MYATDIHGASRNPNKGPWLKLPGGVQPGSLVFRLTSAGFESDGVGLKFEVAPQERLDQ